MYWPEEDAGWVETAIYDGESLAGGHVLAGPAIVEQPGTSVVIPPGADARVDGLRNLIITLQGAGLALEAEIESTDESTDVLAVGSME